ncbi:unnamed protein product [Coregonus sp. 'balchen']|nr:unnamed protein product [Coregonus sp. 'balchen']
MRSIVQTSTWTTVVECPGCSFKGRTLMTHATQAIYCCRIKSKSDDMLYTETDLEGSMDKLETINLHEVAGINFWCCHTGHVLGAAMIEIAGVKEDGHHGCRNPQYQTSHPHHITEPIVSKHCDILSTHWQMGSKFISLSLSSTNGMHIHEKREEREAGFCNTVHGIVNREGRCLIPVAQELLHILGETFRLKRLCVMCMAVYQTYVNAMNDKIRKAININNLFGFKNISNLKSMHHFDDIGPSVVMASPGMMQSGLSRELFERWCTDKRNRWIANPLNDMYADAVTTFVLEIQSNPKAQKGMAIDFDLYQYPLAFLNCP